MKKFIGATALIFLLIGFCLFVQGQNTNSLTGYYSLIGQEDINWGVGTETFAVQTSPTTTITLTSLPSLLASMCSLIKGKWYVTASTGDQSNASLPGTVAWIAAQVSGAYADVELPMYVYTFSNNYTVPANIHLIPQYGTVLSHGANTLTLNGPFPNLNWQVFSGAGSVTFGSGVLAGPANPAMWGGGSTGAAGSNLTNVVQTLTANSATPDVSSFMPVYKTNNSSGTVYSNFVNGIKGQVFDLVVNDANSSITLGTNILGLRGAAGTLSLSSGDLLHCTYDGTYWHVTGVNPMGSTALTANSATPSVAAGSTVFTTANTVSTTITNFTNPKTGQTFQLIAADAKSSIQLGTNILGMGGSTAAFLLSQGDVVQLAYDGSNWHLTAVSLSANVQVFTSSGTWTKPGGAKIVYVEAIGAGGGGGGGIANSGTGNPKAGGAGGGGSGFARRTFNASDLPATVSVYVPAGGVAGPAGFAGTLGGTSSFGVYVEGAGGAGGAVGAYTSSSNLSGSGGGCIGLTQGATFGVAANALSTPTYFTPGCNYSTADDGTGIGSAGEYGGGAGGGTKGTTSDCGYASLYGAGGGGAGGGASSGNGTSYAGMAGGLITNAGQAITCGGGYGGPSGGNAGGAGANGSTLVAGAGGGGGGGQVGASSTAGTGANGGTPGGGGGGGGSCGGSSCTAGSGGTGGAGVVRVYTYF